VHIGLPVGLQVNAQHTVERQEGSTREMVGAWVEDQLRTTYENRSLASRWLAAAVATIAGWRGCSETGSFACGPMLWLAGIEPVT
jgi:hypothetical protein